MSLITNTGTLTITAVGSLPSWVPTVVGTWAQIPNSALSTAPRVVTGLGNTGPSSKTDAFNGWAFDPIRNIVWVAGCGGHNDYGGNEVDKGQLGASGMVWSEPRAGSSTSQYSANGAVWTSYNDGRPSAVHTGYGEIYDDRFGSTGRVLRIGGSVWNTGGSTTQFNAYNIDAGDWASAATLPNTPNLDDGLMAYCRDPRNGNIWAIGQSGQIYHWTWVTSGGSWTSHGTVAINGYRTAAAFDTTRNRIFFCAGADVVNHHTVDPATGLATAQPSTGFPTGADLGMVYVPSLDSYVVRGGAAGGALTKINASTFAVSSITTTGGTSIPAVNTAGIYTKFMYAPLLKSVMTFPQYQANGWICRVEP